MLITRRFLVLLALMVWQGGFMFYGAVVVPVVRAQLEGPERSLITQRVTGWMNLVGTIGLLLMFADVWAGSAPVKRWRWLTWAGMALPHLAVVWLHRELSHQMATGNDRLDKSGFLLWHGSYLACNVVQWFAGMAFAVLALARLASRGRRPFCGPAVNIAAGRHMNRRPGPRRYREEYLSGGYVRAWIE